MPITLFQLVRAGEDASRLHAYRFTFATREEAERYAADYKASYPQSTYTVVPLTTTADLVYSGPSGIGGFSVWSDGRILQGVTVYQQVSNVSPETGEPYSFPVARVVEINPGGVAPAAVQLIKESLGSDSARPDWLGRVRDVARSTVSQSASAPGGYQGATVERLTLTLDDGTTLRTWVRSVGYAEGYGFDFYDSSREALNAGKRLDWLATECWECGAVYDRPGFVEPGEMGCDRCNSEATASMWPRHLVK